MILCANAHAKVNLCLYVTGVLGSGYHTIQSIFTRLGLHDVVCVEHSDDLECQTSNDTTIIDNIALKAASALRDYTNCNRGAKILIKKFIPVAAGLGGGSSDAASVMLLLKKLWNLKIDDESMLEIAKSIGADVPFFLQPHNAVVTGIGDIITPISHKSLPKKIYILLINPNTPLLAKDVYMKYAEFQSNGDKLTSVIFANSFSHERLKYSEENLLYGANDLQNPAIAIDSTILESIELLQSQSGCIAAKMSGSGPTCFGFFEDLRSVKNASKAISQSKPAWWCHFESVSL